MASRGLAFASGLVTEATAATILSKVSGGGSNALPAASDGSNWLILKKENFMSNITLVLNDSEQQAFHQLLDIALRQVGLNALDVVYHFRGRILSAQGTPLQAEVASQKPAATAAAHPPLALAQVAAQAPAQPAQAAHVQPIQTQTVQAHPAQAAQTHPQPAQAAQHSNAPATPQHQSILGEIIDGLTGKQHTATAPAATSAVPAAAAAPVATSVAPTTTSAVAATAAQTVAAPAPQNTVSAPHS